MIRAYAFVTSGIAVGGAGLWLLFEQPGWEEATFVLVIASLWLMARADRRRAPEEPQPKMTPAQEWWDGIRSASRGALPALLLLIPADLWAQIHAQLPFLPASVPTEADLQRLAWYGFALLWFWSALRAVAYLGQLDTQPAA